MPSSAQLHSARTPSEAAGACAAPLADGRTQVVFGEGNPDAELVLVGEAPGFHEDRRRAAVRRPRARASRAAARRRSASRSTRRTSRRCSSAVHPGTAIRCRRRPPPASRTSTASSSSSSRRSSRRSGSFATTLLSGRALGITRVHGQEQVVTLGGRTVTLLPLYHPAAALYTPTMLEVLERDVARLPALLAQRGEPRRESPAPPARAESRRRARRPRSPSPRAGAARALLNADELELESGSAEETEAVAARLPRALLPGDVVLVSGELGSGKTTFVRGRVARARRRGPRDEPDVHDRPPLSGRVDVSHLDLYRFRGLSPAEWGDLEPYFEDAIVFVEWPEAGVGRAPAGTRARAPRARRPETRRVAVAAQDDCAGTRSRGC